MIIKTRVDHFRFGSIFIKKKVTKPKYFFKKTETEPKPVQTNQFRFGFLEQKPVQIGLARFFRFWLGFSGLARFFSVWVRFGSIFWVSDL
jgi:hypothetical protein